jgi:sugar phosphate isomerase/epimerase
MKMLDAFKPSILLCETHFHYRDCGGIIASAVERIGYEGFFQSVEVPALKHREDRKQIHKAVIRTGLDLTTWMSYVLIEEGLNLSSLDESIRKKSVRRILEKVDEAIESGSTRVAVLSGPDPGLQLRRQAKANLFVSLCELCETLEKNGNCSLTLEPLDRGAHKNGLIGPTGESIQLVRRVRKSYSNMFVNWDSAHVALNGEDILRSFAIAADMVDGIHLADAVLDPSSELFGDHHRRILGNGFLDIPTITKLFQKAWEIGWFEKNRKRVSVEVRTLQGEDPWTTIGYCRHILKEAWDHFIETFQ